MKFMTLVLFAFLVNSAFAQSSDTAPDEAARFVATMKGQALAIYDRSNDESARRAELCNLVDQIADTEQMTRSALGRHARAMSKEQLAVFRIGFRNMMVQVFDRAFQRLRGAVVNINPRSRKQEDGAVVDVLLEASGNRFSQRLQFFLSGSNEANYRMVDVALNGARLIFAKRSEFDGLVSRAEQDQPGSGPAALLNQVAEYANDCP